METTSLHKKTNNLANNSLYKIRDGNIVVPADGVSSENIRHYVLRVRDLPSEDKPRERLTTYGATALTVPELLAVILGTGTKKEHVLSIANRIVQEYGERSFARHNNPAVLAAEADIPLGKAMQIVAASELGRRFYGSNRAEKVIRTARDVFEYLHDMRNLSKEQLRAVYLNNHYRVIHDEIISIGTIDANIIHPREVFKPAIQSGASAVVLAHNHPSGVIEPSSADVEVTNQLIEAGRIVGIHVVDHVIIGRDSYMSVKADYE